jgi:CheY-like chemotaxis protein
MQPTTAVLVDDCPDQLRLLARVLQRAGWQVHTAAGSIEGEALAARILAGPAAAHTVILTDMHMPGDPYAAAYPWAAGAYLALRLRARMQWGQLPCAPIIGLTNLLEPAIRTAALAFGCDAVLEKDPPLSLAARITAALQEARSTAGLDGLDAMLRLAGSEESRQMDGRAQAPQPVPLPSVGNVNAALLAHRRYGLIGLGESVLARALEPQAGSALGRGEAAYTQLMRCLDELVRLGAGEAAAILHTELDRQLAPAAQQIQRALSKTAYYRLRRAAIQALVGMLAQQRDPAPFEHMLAL